MTTKARLLQCYLRAVKRLAFALMDAGEALAEHWQAAHRIYKDMP